MLSRQLLVGLVALCTSAGMASATTTKIKVFRPFGGGCSRNPDVDGIAIMKFETSIGGSHFHLHVQDLQPDQLYGVGIVSSTSCDFDLSNPAAIFTNAAGNGTFEVDLPTVDLGPTPTVYLYQVNGGNFTTITGLSCGEFRAVGPSPLIPTIVCPLVPVCSCP